VVFITVQNLVGIDAVVLIINYVHFSISLIHARKFFLGGFDP